MKKTENLNKLTRKELLNLAKVLGIKKRTNMKKEELIKAIKNTRKAIEEIKKLEDELKKKVKKTNEEHIIALAKEPEYVFVNWETEKVGEGVIRVLENDIEKFSIPVNLKEGKSYFKVEEDKEVKVELGIIDKKGKFEKLLDSNKVLVPTSKQTFGTSTFKNLASLKKAREGKIKQEEMNKYIEQEEKTRKELKYLRFGKEEK
ncbi:MAG: DUF4912 domain-containing protein [Caldisericaceae bacterium]